VNLEYVIKNLLLNLGFEVNQKENPASILIAEYLLIELIFKNSNSLSLDQLSLETIKELFFEESQEENL